jgi:hypothetical protein
LEIPTINIISRKTSRSRNGNYIRKVPDTRSTSDKKINIKKIKKLEGYVVQVIAFKEVKTIRKQAYDIVNKVYECVLYIL